MAVSGLVQMVSLVLLLGGSARAMRAEEVVCQSPCSSDLQCSLNGVCIDGRCRCEVAWTGDCCERLNFLPVPRASSYRSKNVSTWGGNIVTLDNVTFHMWIAEMAPDPRTGGGCGLTTWSDNSQITHVVASSADGPYQRREIAVGIWSHNPTVRVVPTDKTLVMWHIGGGGGSIPLKGYCNRNGTSPCGEQSFDKCTGPSTLCSTPPVPGWTCHSNMCSGDGADGDCGSDLAEPTLACNNTPADCVRAAAAACAATAGCNSFGMSTNWEGINKAKLFSAGVGGLTGNPDWSVWVRNADGVEYADMYARARQEGTHPATLEVEPDGSCFLNMHTAASTSGPWTPYRGARITPCGGNNPAPFFHPNGTLYIVFTDENMGLWRADTWQGPYTLVARGACGGGEDPSLFFDKQGRFHCLYHRSPFSNPDIAIGHSYSEDGYTWYVAQAAAANSTIQYEGLGDIVHGKRERPHLAFSAGGDITHLVTGVCINPACNPLDGRPIDPTVDCSAGAQYYRCDANSPGPGWFDSTYTLVQAVQTA